MRLATFVSVLVLVVLTASQGLADTKIVTKTLTSATFDLGYGVSSSTGNPWTLTENSGNNTPTTQGNFSFSAQPTAADGDYGTGWGCTFDSRTLTDGDSYGLTGYKSSTNDFTVPVVASYNGSAPLDVAQVPNYKLTLDITEISIWGQTYASSSAVIAWDELGPGGTGSATWTNIGGAAYVQSNFADASRYSQLNLDAGSYEVPLSSLNDTLTRTFEPYGNWLNWVGLDGLQVKGTVSLTYDAVEDFDYPLLFDWGVSPAYYGMGSSPNTTYPYGFHADYPEITPIPFPGHYFPADDYRVQGALSRCYSQDRPVGINLTHASAPLSGTLDPNALSTVMNYLDGQNERLDYVFTDIEIDWGSQDRAELTEVIRQTRTFNNSAINQARIGAYDYFPGANDMSVWWSANTNRSTWDTFYRADGPNGTPGLNVAMPNIYAYSPYKIHTESSQWGNNTCPNIRSSLLWGPLEHFSTAARELKNDPTLADHQLIPWVGGFLNAYGGEDYRIDDPADQPTHEDTQRLLQHTRLRGADGYYVWATLDDSWYDPTYPLDYYGYEAFRTAMIEAWQELDWLFEGVDKDDIKVLNQATNKTGGFEWSAVETPNGVAVLASDLNVGAYMEGSWLVAAGMDPDYVELLYGALGHQYIPANTHVMNYFKNTIVPGDANGDGRVNSTDASILAQHWLQESGVTWAMGDFNRDGVVNEIDATLLAANWNTTPTASVPEPSSIAFLVSGVCVWLLRRRRTSRLGPVS